jgi:hypothetical protein
MNKIIAWFIIFICWTANSQSQSITVSKINTITHEMDDFVGFDGLGNYFFIKNNVLYKQTSTELLQYQNLLLGKIDKVDLVNPLKVVVFYKAFNTVVVLDNLMNEIQRIDFSSPEIEIIASATGISSRNKLWVFNVLNQQIGLYDLNSNTYQNLGVPIKNEIDVYQTDFNYFHWINEKNEWNTSTIFGRVTINGIVDASDQIHFIDLTRMLFSIDGKLYFKDLKENQLYQIDIFEKSFKKFYYKDQILSIFTDRGITNYKITLP